jgi:hypothetical protein
MREPLQRGDGSERGRIEVFTETPGTGAVISTRGTSKGTSSSSTNSGNGGGAEVAQAGDLGRAGVAWVKCAEAEGGGRVEGGRGEGHRRRKRASSSSEDSSSSRHSARTKRRRMKGE